MLVTRRMFLMLGALLPSLLALAAIAASSALAGPTVTVRIEGESSTLLPKTSVTLNSPEPVSGCAANSVATAINLAVGGNWDHGEASGGAGNFTQTILGETHAFANESDTWAEWVNYKWGGGICSDLLSEGDEVVMVADHEPEPFYSPTVLPLVVSEAPTSVQAGTPFTVKVSAIHTPAGAFAEKGDGEAQPAAGVTVSGGGASTTSAAGGLATLTLSTTGNVTLRAAKTGDAPSASFVVCVHNGNDGNCGTTSPSGTTTSTTGGGAPSPAPYKGPYALVADVTGPIDDHVYPRRSAPRVLAGTIAAHSAVTSVSAELRRRYRGRCSVYDGVRTRFRPARCGSGSFFKLSDGGVFSYLLPSALAPGRYVLDIKASDAVGNTTTLARGTSRLVFYVR
ncbi:MAG TPA: hypothetical protein VFY36_06615 [Solirubrobacteraceae bacterium]|nr:hypothetical protein [Solirubrobacteraceae bacterium]